MVKQFHGDRVESSRSQICDAITARRVLAFSYEGLERVVEPHRCGHNTAGHDALLAWLLRGYSGSGTGPGWRTYLLSDIRNIRALEETFTSGRPGYNPAEVSMRLVYCQLPPGPG